MELEGKHETNQYVVLKESIGTRSKREDDNVEQMHGKKKNLKRKKKREKEGDRWNNLIPLRVCFVTTAMHGT